jgi:hypothetical protein
MTPSSQLSHCQASIEELHVAFLSILPRIETHARIAFRHLVCTATQEDRIAETVALAWKWFIRLAQKGKDGTQFASTLASLAARAVRCGRRLCGQERSKDVHSRLAGQKHGFRVEPLSHSTLRCHESVYCDPHGQELMDAFEERLQDNTCTSVPEQVAFRLDWPCFLQTLSERDRDLLEFLSLGHLARDAADRFQLTPGRVTQLRQQWCREWAVFQGEVV